MNKQLLKAYQQTTYRVIDPEFDIRIGELHPNLDQFLRKSGHKTWAFITAWNPKSQELSTPKNQARNRSLISQLNSHHFTTYKALGIPDNDDWTPEESLFVPGISGDQAMNLGEQFGQNAFVFGETEMKAKLIIISVYQSD